MDPIVRNLIDQSTSDNQFDENLFIRLQSQLAPDLRMNVRYSPELAKMYFGIDFIPANKADYYFWDNTTLCFKMPLQEYVKDGFDVLEIGPGAVATLSLHVRKNWKNVKVTCAEINPEFIRSATENIRLNNENIPVVQSDMTQNIKSQFDVVFMNPPYVKTAGLKELKIDPNSPEGKAGFAGDDGSLVARKFIKEVPRILKTNGVALLGINTRHLEDETVESIISGSELELIKKYYSSEHVYPKGPYSQIYVLQKRK